MNEIKRRDYSNGVFTLSSKPRKASLAVQRCSCDALRRGHHGTSYLILLSIKGHAKGHATLKTSSLAQLRLVRKTAESENAPPPFPRP